MISIANDFSKYPAGRYYSHGPYSGERFREEVLVPKLRAGHYLMIDLNGTLGYGSSFLEEAFGGLVRKEGFSSSALRQKLEFKARDESLLTEIWGYINKARPE